MGRKLSRSRHNKVLAGVCAGIAEYFELDPTIVRLGFVIMTFFGGTGVIAYIVALFIMPEQESYRPSNNFFNENTGGSEGDDDMNFDSDKDFSQVMGDSMKTEGRDPQSSKTFVGICLILLGLMFLAKQFLSWINPTHFFPVILMVIGFLIIFKGGRK